MKSKWLHIKSEATRLRKTGLSLKVIHNQLGVPLSTLSGWFSGIKLTESQKNKLNEVKKKALTEARIKAVEWHNDQKRQRIELARQHALATLSRINIYDNDILEVALSLLYLGEGSKKNTEAALGSSDPLMLNFYLTSLKKIYGIDKSTLRYELYLRADQSPCEMVKFWSEQLGVSEKRFKHVNVDQRTVGKKTYTYYKGVCSIRGGEVAIQRRLMYLSKYFCEKVIQNHRGA